MDKLMRLLCIIGDLDVGGAETFLMKVLRKLDREKYMIDFLLFTDKQCVYTNEAINLGSRIFIATSKEKNPLKSFIDVYRIVKEGQYKAVLKVSEYSIGAIDIFASMLAGAKKRAFRSTNAGSSENKIKLFLNQLMIPFLRITCNVLIAPSTEAAIFTFGKSAVNRNIVHYLNNGVLLDEYVILENETTMKQNELNLQGKFVVGHIGRFSRQKNHKFLIDVFEKIVQMRNDSVLLLIGDGELREETEYYIKQKKLNDYIRILGVRNDIPSLLSTMNVILLPSLFEGMPNVLIEAQAAGVPAVVSDSITTEANITGLVKYLSLSDTPEVWASESLNVTNYAQEKCQMILREKRYDIESVVNEFVSLVY